MAADTAIEWADSTFNAWSGCTKVSPACRNCYAERWAKRIGRGWGETEPRVITAPDYWSNLDKWKRADARAPAGTPPRLVFVNSLSDFFDEWPGQVVNHKYGPLWINPEEPLAYPISELGPLHSGTCVPYTLDHLRARMLGEMLLLPDMIFLVLTKRPDLAAAMLRKAWQMVCRVRGTHYHGLIGEALATFLPNVWIGTTVEADQYKYRIRHAAGLGASVTFVSHEPAFDAIKLNDFDVPGVRIGSMVDWIITGGESGSRKILSPAIVRTMRDQCKSFDIPFFFKQWGEVIPRGEVGASGKVITGGDLVETHEGVEFVRCGVKIAGNHIDGQRHQEWPELARRK